MDTLQPSISLHLLGSHAGIVDPALIRIVNKPVWSPGPDELGDGVKQDPQFAFGVLMLGDIQSCADEILDLLAGITMGGNRHQNVQIHLGSWMDSGLKAHGFSPAGSRNGSTQLLLDRRVMGPRRQVGERFANYLLSCGSG